MTSTLDDAARWLAKALFTACRFVGAGGKEWLMISRQTLGATDTHGQSSL